MRYKCVRFSMILGQTVIPGVQAVVVVVPVVVDAVQVHHIPEQEDGGV